MRPVAPVTVETQARTTSDIVSPGVLVFNITYPFHFAADIVVSHVLDNVVTPLALDADYDIDVDPSFTGGTLTLHSGFASGTIDTERNVLPEQKLNTTEVRTLRSLATEQQLDRLTMAQIDLIGREEGYRSRLVMAEYGEPGFTVDKDIPEGATLIRSGQTFVAGPTADDIPLAQGYAEAAQAAASSVIEDAAMAHAAAQSLLNFLSTYNLWTGKNRFNANIGDLAAMVGALELRSGTPVFILEDTDTGAKGAISAESAAGSLHVLADWLSTAGLTSAAVGLGARGNVSVYAYTDRLRLVGSTFLSGSSGGPLFAGEATPTAQMRMLLGNIAAGQIRTMTMPDRNVVLGENPMAILAYQVAQNTSGGAAVATTWSTRPLNTELADADNIVSISANQFTVAVDCLCSVQAGFYATTGTAIRIYNVTDSAVVADSLNMYNPAANSNMGIATCAGRLTAGKTYRVEYYTSIAQSPNGLGIALNIAGRPETHMLVTLEAA